MCNISLLFWKEITDLRIFFFFSSAEMSETPAAWTGVTILRREKKKTQAPSEETQTSQVTEVLIKTKRENIITIRKTPTPLLPSSAWCGRRLSRDRRFMLIVMAFHFGKECQNSQRRLICKFSSEYIQSFLFCHVKYTLFPLLPPPFPQIAKRESWSIVK